MLLIPTLALGPVPTALPLLPKPPSPEAALPAPVVPLLAEPAVHAPAPRAPPPPPAPPAPPTTEPPPKPKFAPVWAHAANGLATRGPPRKTATNTMPRTGISVGARGFLAH